MLYQDKDSQELESILSKYIENFKIKTGNELDLSKLSDLIKISISNKEIEMFQSVFKTLSILDLKKVLTLIEKPKVNNDSGSQVKKSKKKNKGLDNVGQV